LFQDRARIYEEIERRRKSSVLVYVTGNRKGLETQISPDVLPLITDHLDAIGDVECITLILHTNGGDVMASWSIANLLRQFCKRFEVIVPERALSGGTLLCLGADQVIMTKQAALGPIDPSVSHPLNPQIPGAPGARAPVSVEAINGYLEFLRTALGKDADVSQHTLQLATQIHPLVLGQVYRTRSQIRMLGEKLLSKQIGEDEGKRKKILDFLCSESGSHDYTISRQEARDELGLKVERPDGDLYRAIKAAHDNFRDELELSNPFDVKVFIGGLPSRQYAFRRGLIESRAHGAHVFVSEGQLTRHQNIGPQGPQEFVQDSRTFESWKYEPVVSSSSTPSVATTSASASPSGP
jgi:hypothetical protein